jgi:hypothetical protein
MWCLLQPRLPDITTVRVYERGVGHL